MNIQENSISELISAFTSSFPAQEIPGNVLDLAKLCIIDTVGIAYASRSFDFSQAVLKTMTELSGPGTSPVIGQSKGLSMRDAAFCNAALIHGLDYDDTHLDAVTHCSSSLWPVALSVGLATNSPGMKTLVAFIFGTEITARIGIVAEGQLQKLGHHPTGIIGAFGCTITASYLFNLSTIQIQNAIGIVSSMAAGNMEFITEGAWTKRIHPAWAAVSGITAASLAKHNFVGPKRPLEGQFGLFKNLLGQDKKNEIYREINTLGTTWQTLGNAIKPYPACHFNHAFADCALKLKREHKLTSNSIRKITALVHRDQIPVVCEPIAKKRRPANSYEAQFSIPYIISAVFVYNRFTLEELTADALSNPSVLDLATKIYYTDTDRSLYPKYFSGIIIVETTDNQTIEVEVKYNRGSLKNPLSESEIKEKFSTNCSSLLSEESRIKILGLLDSLEDLSSLNQIREAITADR